MAAQPEQEEESFVEFLRQKGLEKYASELDKHGITSRADLQELNAGDLEKLGERCQMPLGHIAKFRNLVFSSSSSSSSSGIASSILSSSSSGGGVGGGGMAVIPLSVPEMEAMKQFGPLQELLAQVKQEWEQLGRDHVKSKLAEGYGLIQQTCAEARAAIDKEEQRAMADLQSLAAQLLDSIQSHLTTVANFIGLCQSAEQECTVAFRNTTAFSQVDAREKTILSTTKRVFEASFPRLSAAPDLTVSFNFVAPRIDLSRSHLNVKPTALVPTGITFLGFSNPFQQEESRYTTEEQDALIWKTVQDQYGKEARPLTGEEYENASLEIAGLPATNTSGKELIFVYPGRKGNPYEQGKSGYSRNYVGVGCHLSRSCTNGGAWSGTRMTIVVKGSVSIRPSLPTFVL